MPIILPRDKGSNALLETDYHIITAEDIGQLSYKVGEILKRNVDARIVLIYLNVYFRGIQS